MTDAPGSSRSDPKAEYTRRRDARLAVAGRHERLHVRFGNFRLAVAVIAALIGWLALVRDALTPWWLLAPAVCFVVLAILHDRVLRARSRELRAAAFYDQGLARLSDRWAGTGEAGDRFSSKEHLYSDDLDLFGKGGLFELLSIARTRAGEETLARWLLSPAPLDALHARHAAVDELRPRLDLREDLAVLGEEVRAGLHSEPLAAWGDQPPTLNSPRARIAAAALALAAVAALVLWIETGHRITFFAVLVLEAAFGLHYRKRVERAVHAAELPSHDLALLSEVLARLEREKFHSPMLAELRARLDTETQSPSRSIARLNRLMELLDSRENVVLRVFGPPLLWTTQLAFTVENWRKHHGPAVRRWLEAVGEIEALSSLSGYSWEHPADPFPELTEDGPRFDGEGLGHPLIPEAGCVRNDLRLGSDVRMLVVSGSNMSGKSTLLRTVGVNAVLAMAGAPVRATRLRLSELSVGASIRVVDSLQGGTSRFYAEIKRLRRLVDLCGGQRPVLFLLDELLHGTNSHDRRTGSEAVVRGLVERGAIGLVTTHDLALAHIAEVLSPPGSNVHFEDNIEDGRITFDYILRPGVVRKSNALELMRSVGLDV